MNGTQHYDYWSAYAAAVEKKQRETAGYIKHLFILAMSVLGVTVIVQAASLAVFTHLPIFPSHPDWAAFTAALAMSGSPVDAQDAAYILMWLANDITMYIPSLIAFGLIFRKNLDYQKPGDPYVFKNLWILPFFLAGIAIATGSSIITSIASELFSGIFGGDHILPEVFRDVMPQTNTQLLVMLFTVGIVAPVCEEIIYRHLLLTPLRRYGDLQAVIITSILFGFFHGNMAQFLYTTMVGFILGIAAVKAGSVTPAIIIHMMNNIYVILNSHLLTLSERSEIPMSSASLSALNITVLLMGVIALVIMGVKNILAVENYSPFLSSKERVNILVRRPSVVVTVVILILVTIIGTLS